METKKSTKLVWIVVIAALVAAATTLLILFRFKKKKQELCCYEDDDFDYEYESDDAVTESASADDQLEE